MRCHICDKKLVKKEINQDPRNGEWLPCVKCLTIQYEAMTELEEWEEDEAWEQ